VMILLANIYIYAKLKFNNLFFIIIGVMRAVVFKCINSLK